MSGMSSIIGSNPITAALERRGLPASLLQQQSMTSPIYQPGMQQPPTSMPPEPDHSPMAGIHPTPQIQHPQPTSANPTEEKLKTEAETITKALSDRQKALTKREDEKHKFIMQLLASQMPQPQPGQMQPGAAPQTPQPQTGGV